MTFEAVGIRLEGNAESSLQIEDGEAHGTLIVTGLVTTPDRGVNGTLTITRKGRDVTMPTFIYRQGHRFEAGQQRSSFRVLPKAIIAIPDVAPVAYVRETIIGMYLGHHDMATAFSTTFFGRVAFIAGYSSKGPTMSVDALQVIYDGAPIANDKRFALFDVLRFLSGRRGQSWFYEAFDADLNLLGFYYENHGRLELHSLVPPVNLHPVIGREEVALLAHEFPRLVDSMRDLRAHTPLAAAAMMHHYNDGSMQESPTSKMRDMSVALEALGIVLMGRPAERSPIIDPKDFSERFKLVMEAFANAFGDLETTAPQRFEWLQNKIKSLNIASPREELFEALHALQIGLSEKERAWIRKMRNVVLHNGYHGDESDAAGLEVNSEAAGLFANVFARALLRRLGFSGRYQDAVSYEDRYSLDTAPPYPSLPEKP